MIIFANNMQQEFLKAKNDKILIATSMGSGKTYALYLKIIALLEEPDNFVGFCRFTYPQMSMNFLEFKRYFSNYKNLRFSDKSFIVENKKTGSKVKFVTQDSCYGFETVIIDCLNHFNNFDYLKRVKSIYAVCNACDYNKEKHGVLFKKVITGYGICEQLAENRNYEALVNSLSEADRFKLLKESIY